jgi:N-acetylmuramoyl-L-alanine amidase
MKICIDKGHSKNGQPDPGASGNNLVEAILTGQLGDIVKQKLSGYEAEVLFAPRGSLDERAAFANNAGADLFVSIHINAGGGTGYETHIHPDASDKTLAIAESIHASLAGWYAEKGNFKDRGLKRSNFAVLRETEMPAVLLENLFIDNARDAAFLRDNLPAIGNEIAWAIVQAMRLKAKKVDPCVNCPKVLKLDMEIRRLRQVIKQAGTTLAPEMV